MARWKVKPGTQVPIGDKHHVGGDTFSATQEEIDELGAGPYVEKVTERKAQTGSPNKAQTSSANKAVDKAAKK